MLIVLNLVTRLKRQRRFRSEEPYNQEPFGELMTKIKQKVIASEGTLDAIVIGAGFAGLYAVFKLREMGLRFCAFEQGDDVGGTWYWNRYPGAGSDSESWVYSFSFSDELEQDWTWSSRFPRQPEILRYLRHVAERFGLRSCFQFNTRVQKAEYDETDNLWIVETDSGELSRSRYLITAVGCLSAAQLPQITGRDTFKGNSYHTGRWPHEKVNFKGQKVGVIGTGSSGIQAIPVIAKEAAHLTVFQRTANYSVPARNYDLSDDQARSIKKEIKEIREFCRWSTIGQNYDFREGEALALPNEQLEGQFEADWKKGGFQWMFGSYPDLVFNEKANKLASSFVKKKIRETVKNPLLAEKLVPKDHAIGTKRLPLDIGYFETFNRENVSLIDLKETPIESIEPVGIKTSDKLHEFDSLVFATGFDALTGPLTRIGIRGKDGVLLKDKWKAGPRTYLGVGVPGFPNMFMVTGPGSPSVLGNMPTSIEQHVDWICDCITYMRANRLVSIDVESRAEEQWSAHVKELSEKTLFPSTDSWYMGSNIPGKPKVFLPYAGGFGTYRKLCNDIAQQGYEGFRFT